MPVFFVPPQCITPPTISIGGDLLIHLRDSLRVTTGEVVLVGDGATCRYRTEITAVTKHAVTGRILDTITPPILKAPALIVGQALLKGEKMDWVIQKATELGVSEIVPLESRHSVVQLKTDRIDHQLARWQRIALEAAQQSEQWRVPMISQPRSLASLLKNRETGTVTLLLAERRGGKSLQTVALPQNLSNSLLLFIGPEGGWSKEEMDIAEQTGAECLTLGEHILRAETAAIAAISILQSRLGILG